jgi:hypothetical protein
MASKRWKPTGRELEFALAGDGVHLGSVSAEDVAELLKASTSLIRAVADEMGHKMPLVSLPAVREGSAAVLLTSHGPGWQALRERAVAVIDEKGRGCGQQTRDALNWLFRIGGKKRSVRAGLVDERGRTQRRAVVWPAVNEDAEPVRRYRTTLHGRVVGISHLDTGEHRVQIARDEGGRAWLVLPPDIKKQVIANFDHSARFDVELAWPDDNSGILLGIDKWNDEADFLEVMNGIARSLADAGIVVGPADETEDGE